MSGITTRPPGHEKVEEVSTLEKLSVGGFPVVVLGCAIVAAIWPTNFQSVVGIVPELLMLVMFTMGLTLTVPDLAQVIKRPWPIFIGVGCQFVVMPLSALLVAKVLGLNEALTVGLILLGSVPGGTASNVIAYLAKGDVALSVAMTSVSTFVSPFATPLLMLLLASSTADIDGTGMMISLFKTVLLPVTAGLIIRLVAGRIVDKLIPFLPWVAIIVIGLILMAVVSNSVDKLLAAGLLVVIAVLMQNLIGMGAGWFTAKAVGEGEAQMRTTAIEVATQNSALAAGLAIAFFGPEAAVPAAVATTLCNLSGAMFAAWVRRRPLDA